MKRLALGCVMGLALGAASAQQVWRCEQDGEVRYTDQPCEKGGRPLPARELKANGADGLPAEPPASAATQGPEPAASAATQGQAEPLPAAVRTPPTSTPRPQRARRVYAVAMMGLMDTDFVQRGYVPRRQNPVPTTNP